jgi:hypothetical protein
MKNEHLEIENKLIQKVFGTLEGKKLLSILSDEFVWHTGIDLDAHKMYYKLGQSELVKHLMIVAGGK